MLKPRFPKGGVFLWVNDMQKDPPYKWRNHDEEAELTQLLPADKYKPERTARHHEAKRDRLFYRYSKETILCAHQVFMDMTFDTVCRLVAVCKDTRTATMRDALLSSTMQHELFAFKSRPFVRFMVWRLGHSSGATHGIKRLCKQALAETALALMEDGRLPDIRVETTVDEDWWEEQKVKKKATYREVAQKALFQREF